MTPRHQIPPSPVAPESDRPAAVGVAAPGRQASRLPRPPVAADVRQCGADPGRSPLPHAVDPMRRTPSQHRSRVRVERILDAAGALVADRGYEATTTSLIARRARVSPGSFYQFFSDKQSVVQALSARNLDVFAGRLDQTLAGGQHRHWADAVEAALDLYVELCRQQPGFRAVRFGDLAEAGPPRSGRDLDTVVADRLAEVLVATFGVRDTADLRLALAMTMKVVDALVRFAFTRHPDGDEQVLNRTHRLVRDHLEGHVQVAA